MARDTWEMVSFFDMMADADIEPCIPVTGASSSSGVARGAAEAVMVGATDADADPDEWWYGSLGVTTTQPTQRTPTQTQTQTDTPDEDMWWYNVLGRRSTSTGPTQQTSPTPSPDDSVPATAAAVAGTLPPSPTPPVVAVPAAADADATTPQPSTSSLTPKVRFRIAFRAYRKLRRSYMTAINEVRADVTFDLSYLMSFSMHHDAVLDQACAAIASIRARFNVVVYKIGIFTNPKYRYYNPLYGYPQWVYSVFTPLWQAFPSKCARLEKALIAKFDRI